MRWAEGGWVLRRSAALVAEKVFLHVLVDLEIRWDRERAGK